MFDKGQPRTHNEVPYGGGHHNIAECPSACDVPSQFDRFTRGEILNDIAFAGMDADPHSDFQSTGGVADGDSSSDRSSGTIEEGNRRIAVKPEVSPAEQINFPDDVRGQCLRSGSCDLVAPMHSRRIGL